jgi:hypothetical protein
MEELFCSQLATSSWQLAVMKPPKPTADYSLLTAHCFFLPVSQKNIKSAQ